MRKSKKKRNEKKCFFRVLKTVKRMSRNKERRKARKAKCGLVPVVWRFLTLALVTLLAQAPEII
jgi:hypothetical protein